MGNFSTRRSRLIHVQESLQAIAEEQPLFSLAAEEGRTIYRIYRTNQMEFTFIKGFYDPGRHRYLDRSVNLDHDLNKCLRIQLIDGFSLRNGRGTDADLDRKIL
jgi:hypothetical protein